jgi:hypothetical protein
VRLSLADLGWLVSPTRKIIDRWKAAGGREHRGYALRTWSRRLFYGEALALAALCIILRQPAPGELVILAVPLLWYSVSRVCEIAYAFYRDPLSPKKESDLTPTDRVRMAMRSYFGLAVNFAVLYYFAPLAGQFKVGDAPQLASFLEAVYFSGVTLATLGYGDVVPVSTVSRIMALAEVFIGLLVVVVAIAAYIGAIKEREE